MIKRDEAPVHTSIFLGGRLKQVTLENSAQMISGSPTQADLLHKFCIAGNKLILTKTGIGHSHFTIPRVRTNYLI